MTPFALAMFLIAGGLFGQDNLPSTAGEVSFRFDHPVPGVAVPRYTILLRADGTGTYRAELASAEPSPPIERELRFDSATVKAAFAGVRAIGASKASCASRLKNIADTGNKVVDYRGPAGTGECAFNFTENKGAIQLTDLFQGIEFTLEEGRALDFKHRFDRLGLDAEMIALSSAVDSGRATALEVIASTLRSIVADTELIERVRLRASKLLARTEGAH